MSIDIAVVDLGDGLIEETRVEEIGTPGTKGYGKQTTVRILNLDEQKKVVTDEFANMETAKRDFEYKMFIAQKVLTAIDGLSVKVEATPA